MSATYFRDPDQLPINAGEDNATQLEYRISVYKNSPLTKEELVAIAESIMRE
ncbi:hypothetical protein [Paenibacillus sp. A14]|uniref:hypothetical protein n=1 Tax=Paenibacillus sp. A14 TaxID=3119820 RepID=UPI002FE35481